MSVPTCKKCGNRHFNLFKCKEAEEKLNGAQYPPLESQPKEGWSDWGNRPSSGYTYQGGVLWRTGKARKRGNVIEPEDHG